jgi:hypothetical protein
LKSALFFFSLLPCFLCCSSLSKPTTFLKRAVLGKAVGVELDRLESRFELDGGDDDDCCLAPDEFPSNLIGEIDSSGAISPP